MQKSVFILLVFLSSCLSQAKLAQKCLENFPCGEIHRTDTVAATSQKITTNLVPLINLPIQDIKCFEYHDGKSIEIHALPIPMTTETITKVVNHWYEDSAKLKLAAINSQELAKLNNGLSEQVLLLQDEVGRLNAKKRGSEFWVYGLSAALILTYFLIGVVLYLASKFEPKDKK